MVLLYIVVFEVVYVCNDALRSKPDVQCYGTLHSVLSGVCGDTLRSRPDVQYCGTLHSCV